MKITKEDLSSQVWEWWNSLEDIIQDNILTEEFKRTCHFVDMEVED